MLRQWRDDDVPHWVAMSADPRVMRFFPSTYAADYSEQMAIRMRDRLERDGYGWWVIEIKGITPFAGAIILQDVPFEAPFTPAIEIGWRLAYQYWGHGYATEGATRVMHFAFEVLRFNEVVAMTAITNVRSQRVMERLRMTHNAQDDFLHPRLPEEHALRPHVLYRRVQDKND